MLTEVELTDVVLSPGTPLTVVVQNNTSFYSAWGDQPECSRRTPVTHLILYANIDRSGLILNSWNCSSGLTNQTAQISGLMGRNRRYLGLASHDNGKVYVQYDQGLGPEIEEWSVPETSLGQWTMSSKVNVELSRKYCVEGLSGFFAFSQLRKVLDGRRKLGLRNGIHRC
jgi:hypothetical protein